MDGTQWLELGRWLHGSVGLVALAGCWIALLSVKGSPRHRRAGRIYLIGMLSVMGLSSLMVLGKALQGDPALAVFLTFLMSMVGTASWLMWFSVRRRRQPDAITGVTYRVLASWLILAGALLFALGVSRGMPLVMFLSLLGLCFGGNMWRLALRPGPAPWLSHHLNGVMLNFIATHDSFLALAVGSVVPVLREPVPRMSIAVGITLIALAGRAYFGSRSRGVRGVAVRGGEAV